MDRSWMEKRRFSVEYIKGVSSFMNFIQDHFGDDVNIHCPCKSCLNVFQEPQEVVLSHLMVNGIDVGYTRWVYHGEQFNADEDDLNMLDNDLLQVDEDDEEDKDEDENEGDEDNLFDLLDEHEEFIQNDNNLEGDANGRGYADYIEMLGQAQKDLYPSCTKYSQLSFIVKLLHLKVYNKWSNKSFDMLLKLLKDILPEGNSVPESYYVAKKLLRSLGLGYTPIHACKYDCALFWNDNELLEACPVCKTSRWERNDGKGKKIPWKILRYFPLKPRLRRLFMSSKTAREMRWHKEKRNDDDKLLRHPADSTEWKNFDIEFPWFAEESRNVRLGLASDGFNPFGNMSTSYSMWPVVLTPYNLPPWMCMKEHFLFLTLLLPGPTAPGKDIDVYMQPLIKELKELAITNIRDVAVQEKIWRHFLRLVRGKREKFHKQNYNGKGKGEGNGETAKKHKPDMVPEAMWNSLCDYWDDEKVKKICQTNKMNRAQLKKPHTEGPVSFVSSLHELKEQHGDSFTLIDFWKKSHTKKNGDWASVECQIEYDKMNEKVNASMETENSIAPDEAFFETLGTGHGYIKGLGYGPTPPSARKTYLETENAELRDLNNKLVEENQQLKEKCVELQDNVNDLKARQEATEAKQAEIQAENDARQAENEARQAACDAKQAEMEKMLQALMARNS